MECPVRLAWSVEELAEGLLVASGDIARMCVPPSCQQQLSRNWEKAFALLLVWIVSGEFAQILVLPTNGGSCFKPRQRPPQEFALVLRAKCCVCLGACCTKLASSLGLRTLGRPCLGPARLGSFLR